MRSEHEYLLTLYLRILDSRRGHSPIDSESELVQEFLDTAVVLRERSQNDEAYLVTVLSVLHHEGVADGPMPVEGELLLQEVASLWKLDPELLQILAAESVVRSVALRDENALYTDDVEAAKETPNDCGGCTPAHRTELSQMWIDRDCSPAQDPGSRISEQDIESRPVTTSANAQSTDVDHAVLNWDKKVFALKTWGTGMGVVFLVSQTLKGELFSGRSSFGENMILAVFTFLLPPIALFLFYWPQTQRHIVSSPTAAFQRMPLTNCRKVDSHTSPIPVDAGTDASQKRSVATGRRSKKVWLVVIALIVAYEIITSLYIGRQKSEINSLIDQFRQQQR